MKKNLLFSLLISIAFTSVAQQKEDPINKNQKRLLSDIEKQIRKYKEDAQRYWDKKDSKSALKYNDSIKAIIINSYINDY